MRGKVSGSNVNRLAAIDKSTRAVETIQYEHHEIHAGDSYHVFHADEDVADKERIVISFKTPSTTKWIHMLSEMAASGEAEFTLYEGMTITDNTGTPRLVYNRNRNSGNTSGVLDTSANPDAANRMTLNADMGSGSAYGEVLEHAVFGDGKKIGGESRGTNEWVLKPNTIYAFSAVSRAASNKIHVHLEWYEHTDKGLTENG